MRLKLTLGIMLGCCLAKTLQASSLGVVGEVFPVAEMSFLQFIEARLTQPEVLSKLDAVGTQAVAQYVLRPTALNLPRAIKSQAHPYLPQIIVHEAVRDTRGQIIVPVGTTVNALEKMPNYQPSWVFFNGDDAASLRWARRESQHSNATMLILTGGSVRATEDALQQPIYFDQGGRISHQLGITHVPAKVTRRGDALWVQEVVIGEDGHVR